MRVLTDAMDAWTTKDKPSCKNESVMAALRFREVESACEEVASSQFPRWALERRLAKSDANCRFRSLGAMLEQQRAYEAHLVASAPLRARCPHLVRGLSTGGVNQVSATFNASDVSGIYILGWEPTHSRLASIAYSSPLRRLMRQRRAHGPDYKLVRFGIERIAEGHERLTCSCSKLPHESWWENVTLMRTFS